MAMVAVAMAAGSALSEGRSDGGERREARWEHLHATRSPCDLVPIGVRVAEQERRSFSFCFLLLPFYPDFST